MPRQGHSPSREYPAEVPGRWLGILIDLSLHPTNPIPLINDNETRLLARLLIAGRSRPLPS